MEHSHTDKMGSYHSDCPACKAGYEPLNTTDPREWAMAFRSLANRITELEEQKTAHKIGRLEQRLAPFLKLMDKVKQVDGRPNTGFEAPEEQK